MKYKLVAATLALVGVLNGTSEQPSEKKTAEERAAALVKQMSVSEKISQLLSTSPAIPRLGIPAYQWWNEALHGAVVKEDSTNFPEPIGLAATFDVNLVGRIASAISNEVQTVHANVRAGGQVRNFNQGGALNVWTPNINIFRDPRWGRGQETYGEDPFLAARFGVAFVRGMQGDDPKAPAVIATPKHFAVYSGPEPTRRVANVVVSQHDLEDTYFPAFRAAVTEGGAGSIMCSYNAVNGTPACANTFLLQDTLRNRWGFQGYVTSDCGAIESLASRHKFVPDQAAAVATALRAGVDLQCIHPNDSSEPKHYQEALDRGLLNESDLDRSVSRLLAARIRSGDLDYRSQTGYTERAVVATPEHRALALESAEQSVVLLKNDGVLPIGAKADLRIVVTGPLAASSHVLSGNYASPNVISPKSLLDGVRSEFPHAEVRFVPAGASITDGDAVPVSVLQTQNGAPGLEASYFAMKGTSRPPMAPPTFELSPYKTEMVDRVGQDHDVAKDTYKVRYSGYLVAPETGTYRIGLKGLFSTLFFEDKPLASITKYPPPQLGDLQTVRLERGHRYPIRIEATKNFVLSVQLMWVRISEDPARSIREAAKDADVIVAAVGINSDLESEESSLEMPGFYHGDRTSLDLPPDQMQLLQDAASTGKPLVVVNLSGSAINLAWANKHSNAILQGWYPGEEGGIAIAHVLSGKVNPAARLPVTFYETAASLPPFADYSMSNRTYRYFSGTPVFSFGYGLSYTKFKYSHLRVTSSRSDHHVFARVRLTNVGAVAGDEVAQLYLHFPDAPGVPRLALRGFQRVHLAAKQGTTLTFDLGPRELSTVSSDGETRVLAGNYQITIGGGQPFTELPKSSSTFRIEKPIALPK